MKFLKLSILVTFFITSTAHAVAPIKVMPKKLDFQINLSGSSGDQLNQVLTTSSAIVIAGTIESTTSGVSAAYLASYNTLGDKRWEFKADTESVGSLLIKASDGYLYLIGSTVVTDTGIAISLPDTATLNPDNVQVQQVFTPRGALKNISIWKVSQTGQLISNSQANLGDVVLPTQVESKNNMLQISGLLGSGKFQIATDLNGNFGEMKSIKTLNDVGLDQIVVKKTGKLKFLISSKPIPGIPSWKPKHPIPILLQYSKLGTLKAANYFQGSGISASYQTNIGFVVLTESSLGYGISIVKPLI